MTDAKRTVGEMLHILSRIGAPSLICSKDGQWHSELTLPAPAGMSVNIRSNFDHATPGEALEKLIVRVADVANLGDKIDAILGQPEGSNLILLGEYR